MDEMDKFDLHPVQQKLLTNTGRDFNWLNCIRLGFLTEITMVLEESVEQDQTASSG